MNQPFDLEDLNRRLTTLAAQQWFTAIARRNSPDDPMLQLEAVTWRDGRRLNYARSYPVSEAEHLGPVAVANAFVEAARQELPRGTANP